jgi:hypothetical protein
MAILKPPPGVRRSVAVSADDVVNAFLFEVMGTDAQDWLHANEHKVSAIASRVAGTRELPWDDAARERFRGMVGGEPQLLSVTSVVRDVPAGVGPAVYVAYRWGGKYKKEAWMVLCPDIGTPDQARKMGERVFRKLIGYRNVEVGIPRVHDLPLVVAYPGGMEWVDPPEKEQVVRTGPTLSEEKDRVLRRLVDAFGHGSRIIGNASEGYMFSIRPTSKKDKFARGTSPRRSTIQELDAEVSKILERAYEMGVLIRPGPA